MNFVYLISFALLLAAGQIMFKKAALVSNEVAGLFGFVNPWLVGAVILYGFTTILWVWILKTVPLSFAYPFTAIGFVVVPLAAIWIFGEPISLKYIFGAVLIVSGIVIVGSAG